MSAKTHLIERASDLGWASVTTDDWIRHFTKPGVPEIYVEFDARGGIIYASHDRTAINRRNRNKLLTVRRWLEEK